MKRLAVVLALALILCFTLAAGSSARVTPDDYVDPSTKLDDGDDHPWGGDDTDGGSGTEGVKSDGITSFNTGFDPISFIFNMWLKTFFPESTETTIQQQDFSTQGKTIETGIDSQQRNF